MCRGREKNPDQVIDEEIINSVEHAKLATKYLYKSTRKTEYHKSTDAQRNGPSVAYP